MSPRTPTHRQAASLPDVDRRLELVERDVDRLLDPETGIYALLTAMESRLKSVAISVLVAVLLNIVVTLARGHL